MHNFLALNKISNRFCKNGLVDDIPVFMDPLANKEKIGEAGSNIFKTIYNGSASSTLGELRHHIFSRKAAAGTIRPQALPPTTGAAIQHSLRAYLQFQDWLCLEEAQSLDPSEYGWSIGVNGFQPTTTLDPVAPEKLLRLTSCNCKKGCSNNRCSCKKNGVKCIPACGVCNGLECGNSSEEILNVAVAPDNTEQCSGP